jgi:pyruvate dehydrogenase E1 component alpha subunit
MVKSSLKSHPSSGKKRMDVDIQTLRTLYHKMVLIRRFEERSAQIYGTGAIGGFCHLYIGQEAIAVGACAAKKPQDTMVTAYRDHGHMLAMDMDPDAIMAELMGKATGCSKGKGGSMHMFAPDKGFYGGHGIVGAQVPFGTGVAFAHKYREDNGVCLTFMGDGAANQGQVFESFNMAALWKLPVLYIIENNGYSMGTSEERACAGDGLYKRGEAFGIPGKQINGMDIVEVEREIRSALEDIRAGGPPHLLEAKTYRYRGHSMSDPGLYRTKDEVDHVKTHDDPLLYARRYLEEAGVNDDELKELEKEVKERVKASVRAAEEAPFPDADELLTDITQEEKP